MLEHPSGEDMGEVVSARLGFELERDASSPPPPGGAEHSLGFTQDDIRQMADGLAHDEAPGWS